MTEFIAILEDLKSLPADQHLLCPRRGDEEQDRYEDDIEDVALVTVEDAARGQKIADTRSRRRNFIDCLQLLAYDGPESAQYQSYIWDRINHALGQCDICIRNYYVARIDFLARLREDYEDEDIKNFFTLIDRQDTARIKRGLDGAASTLRSLPEQKRATSAIEPEHLHALFEALVCEAFLQNEKLLTEHFDEPFRLIQSKKPLKIKEVLPATVQFLFSSNTDRLRWAKSIWDRIERSPTDLEWRWAVKSFLEEKIQQASSPTETARLWSGLKIIVNQLDQETISHKLFDLQPQICTTALNHLNRKSQAVPFITQTLQALLNKAPDAYWQAMGSISSQTVVEQIFSSPQFDKCLQDSLSNESTASLDVLSWPPTFLSSLKLGNRPLASRAIVTQLFNRAHSQTLSDEARATCFRLGITIMLQTIVAFADNEENRQSVERLVLKDTLSMVSDRIKQILRPEAEVLMTAFTDNTRSEVAGIVRNSLALECQCLKTDFELLNKGRAVKQESGCYTPQIWNNVILNLSDDNLKLSTSVLLGIMALPGLEKFRIKTGDSLAKEKQAYNETFEKLTNAVSRVLEKITDFKPEHLDHLFKQQDTSMSLTAALFSADQTTSQAAVDLIKNISGDSSRKDALGHLLEAFFGVTIYSLCWSLRRIANLQTFSSVPRMLKTGLDLIDVLCNSSMGKLRRVRFEERDYAAIQSYWSYQWTALRTVFATMEKWSLEIHDKAMMTEVCRDAIQYADWLFDQYDLFYSVLTRSKPSEKAQDVSKTLLDSTKFGSPVKTLDVMVRWLRLRDQFLADTLVKLITKMLYRLKRYQPNASISGLQYVADVATKNTVRTILSDTQKATLLQALETFTGKQLTRVPKSKQSTLRGWTDSPATVSSSREGSIDEYGDEGIDDDELQEIATRPVNRSAGTSRPQDSSISTGLKAQPIRSKQPDPWATRQAEKRAQERQVFLETRKREQAAQKQRAKEASLKLKGTNTFNAQTANQGSGLNGIGVKGKEHSTPKSEMMVSSGTSSGSDSDTNLFGGRIAPAKPAGHAPTRKQVPSGPVRKIKQIRSQKDMRARLAPDLTSLHKVILGWDFFIDADLPPNSDKDNYTLVTNSFRSAEEYKKTFEPLLVLEGWQSVRAAREDGSFKPYEFKVANSLLVDSFFEVNATMSIAQGQELGLSTADIVLLSKSDAPHMDVDSPHCFARIKEVSRKKGEFQVVYRVNAAANPMRQHLSDKASVHAVRILSLTTLEREYGALMALPYYDLCDEITAAKPSPLLDYPAHELQKFMSIYQVNQAQAKAVRSALDNDAFTLIQGPPGSGKTKTICALVGAMMTGFLTGANSNTPRLNTANAQNPSLPRAAKKILLCAPSNAAVDELVIRLKQGVKLTTGAQRQLQVVRLGRSEAINSQVKDVTLEELVNARLNISSSKDQHEDVYVFMQKHKAISEQMGSLRTAIDEKRSKGQNISIEEENEFDLLKRQRGTLGNKIDALKEKQNSASRDADLNRKRVQQEILDSAHVLCATLSGSGHEIFQGLNVEFETVIIDEAAQSIELSALIPLKYGCSKCILVGDPKQLPPTVLSREAARFQYEQSLFARMEKNHKKDIHLLDTQYRMHPEISIFPSRTFYDSRLKDGGDMAKLRARPWHHSKILGPYRFFDVQGMSQADTKGHSLVNAAEVNVAMQLYERVTKDVPKYNFKSKIGIITPYKGQLNELKRRFRSRYGEDIGSYVEFNTIDAFQGRESEIIIFSCVRASTKGIGFLKDIRRMNVGLTRAKCSLWVLGNANSLIQGEFWRGLINDAKTRELYTDGDINSLLSRPLLTEDMMKDDVNMGDADASEPEAAAETSALSDHDLAENIIDSSNASRKVTPVPSRPSSVMSRQSSSSSVVSVARPNNHRQMSADLLKKTSSPLSRDVSSANATTTPPTGVNGPSGGRFGLNSNANCSVCGSSSHFSYNCPDSGARAAQLGNCYRCQEPGHTLANCTTPRCLECGAYGHRSALCTKRQAERLNLDEKQEVRKQEARFKKEQEKARQKRVEKQMGEHAIKVPNVKESLPEDTPTEPKRKRVDDDVDMGGVPKAPKTSAAEGPNGQVPPRPANGMESGVPGKPGGGPPMIKKKAFNPNDLFIKKR